jgi:hypothetical protein
MARNVIKRRRKGVVLGTLFDTKNLPKQVKRKFLSLLNFKDCGLWEKFKDMEKRCSDYKAKWEARQRLDRGLNETQQQD